MKTAFNEMIFPRLWKLIVHYNWQLSNMNSCLYFYDVNWKGLVIINMTRLQACSQLWASLRLKRLSRLSSWHFVQRDISTKRHFDKNDISTKTTFRQKRHFDKNDISTKTTFRQNDISTMITVRPTWHAVRPMWQLYSLSINLVLFYFFPRTDTHTHTHTQTHTQTDRKGWVKIMTISFRFASLTWLNKRTCRKYMHICRHSLNIKSQNATKI